MAKITLHVYISGKVQGVFYRDSTRKEAEKIGVTGWVRNTNDGRVEAVISGEEEKVELLLDWMRQGPPAAAVNDVTFNEIEFAFCDKFTVKRG